MIIIPAIDLINGQCVRLHQGDFKQKEVFNDDPLAVAKEFAKSGAEYLHVVDLDGAKNQAMQQLSVIESLVSNTALKVQVGGGIRTKQQIRDLLNIGVNRVVIGSKAVTAVAEVQQWLTEFGAEKIVLAIDVNLVSGRPLVKIHGWQKQMQLDLYEILTQYSALKHLLCTDIAKDGLLSGPNVQLYAEILQRYPALQLQASGGVSSEQDVMQLQQAQVPAVIIGKALYTGKINLASLYE